MLSRVAERVYWTARYLERIENTARLIDVYDKLMFDLPRSINISWYNLITLNSAESAFEERYKKKDERNVIKFLVGDSSNYSSIANCLKMARENMRTTRDVIPAESWEQINELNMYVGDNLQQGINRSKRFEFLDGIIKGCQQIQGLIRGTMPHDHAWDFMTLGRNLERADMTTRLLDAGVHALLETEDDSSAINSRPLIWGNLLRSLSAEQSYHRSVRSSAKGALVAEYILEDIAFPRTIAHCLAALAKAVNNLPRNAPVAAHMTKMQQKIFKNVDYSELGEPMKHFLNDLQLDLAAIHFAIAENWFITAE